MSKITIKSLPKFDNPAKPIGTDTNGKKTYFNQRVVIGTFLGIIQKLRIGTNSSMDDVRTFKGQFAAFDRFGIRVAVDENFSPPGDWFFILEDAFNAADQKPVKFCIEVGVIRDATQARGWAWALNPIVRAQPVDTMTDLETALMEYLTTTADPAPGVAEDPDDEALIADQPAADLTPEPVADPTPEPAADPAPEPETNPSPDPTQETVQETAQIDKKNDRKKRG